MTHFSRRVAIKAGIGLAGSAFLPRIKSAVAQSTEEPHYLLQLHFDGSLDASYLFDARPLAFTAAGKIQNYLGQDPSPWIGGNGGKSLASPLTRPLLAFKDCFSVLNGVHMATSFDGHEQNKNALLTGNPFGGEFYLPHLNTNGAIRAPLDYLQVGQNFGITISNAGSSVLFNPGAALSFVKAVQASADLRADDPVVGFLKGRMDKLASGPGRFSEGSRNMLSGLDQSFGLAEKVRATDIVFEDDDTELQKALKLAHQYFTRGISKSAFITINGMNLDTHGASAAAEQPQTYGEVVADILLVFDYLRSTPFDEARGLSLLDVTTVVIASEFDRTNYQEGLAMDKTGTDHNPLSNLMIIGGKGIKSGQIIGASDLDAIDASGSYSSVSGAHQKFDGSLLKRMGKPFDFASMQPSDAKPEAYDGDHYVTVASVVNTLYRLFGADAGHYWKNNRNSPAAQILTGLLA